MENMTFEQLRTQPDVDLAVRMAQRAGDFLRQRPDDLRVSTKSTATDVVTQMDQESEQLITRQLESERPLDGLLGEEGAQRASESGRTWIIDPLDGTVNYLYGLPHWAVSIALVDGGAGLVGVVYAPELDTMWIASRGLGSFRVQANVVAKNQVSAESDIARALTGTGFGYSAQRRTSQARVLTGLLPAVRDIRRLGSCAIDMCAVAQGQLDAYYERGTHSWDHAAGALIVREAGGHVSGLRDQPEGEDMVVATNGHLAKELKSLLENAQADSD